jgi:hypothetical protein
MNQREKTAMNKTDLAKVTDQHLKWLKGDAEGVRANLSGANLSSADLSGANLSGADLRSANLSGANLSSADLSGANLSGANLSGANLSSADLSGANLSGANLSSADLSGANLRGANLSSANLSGANLSGANLRSANLSGAQWVLDPIAYLEEHFELTVDGIVAYKTFGTNYTPPESWKMEAGAILTENVSFDVCSDCACGVNVATRDWIKAHGEVGKREVWKVLIKWTWLVGVCVPLHTDGKIRCGRVQLVENVTSEFRK